MEKWWYSWKALMLTLEQLHICAAVAVSPAVMSVASLVAAVFIPAMSEAVTWDWAP